MKIYTKTGDEGVTSLLGGSRVTKDCITLQVVGGLDELNSVLGMVVSLLRDLSVPQDDSSEILKQPASSADKVQSLPSTGLGDDIINIQKDIFKISGELASLQSDIITVISTGAKRSGEISLKDIEELEKQIDQMEKELPELKNFILPGGSLVSANLHLARAVCRRVERELVSFGKEVKVRDEIFQYLNRLSDFLFVSARWVNLKLGNEEEVV